MKIFDGLFIVALVVLLISAGCTSSEKSTGTISPKLNTSSPNITNFIASIPKDNITDQNMSFPIVGVWKIQTGDQQTLYWQFHNDGNLTGGSEPGNHQITGNWSPFAFKNLFTINAVGTNSNGKQITYNMVIASDPTNGTISVVNPKEDTNWQFIRQQ